MINFGGVSSDSLNLDIERCPDYKKPERKMKKYDIPGRNGDLILMQNGWKNVKQRYEIHAEGHENSVPINYETIAAWLYQDGYQRLIDDFDPEHYRLAYFAGPFDIDNIVSRAGRAKIDFICRPERFLLSGDVESVFMPDYLHIFTNYLTLTNPTQFNAKPTLRIVSTGSAEASPCFVLIGTNNGFMNGFSIAVEPSYSGTMYIDTESLNCYDSSGNNLNQYVTFADMNGITHVFPELKPGESRITCHPGDEDNPNTMITEVGITPHWWTL